MRPAFGNEEETPEKPARKRAAKKAAKKSSTRKKGNDAVVTEDVPMADPNAGREPIKRTRRTREEMEAAGAKPRTRAAAVTSGSKAVSAMRREAERLTAKADAAEAREILTTARGHIKELEREEKELGKAVTANTKALDKARSLLVRLQGPGE